MNIFWLAVDLILSAVYHCDQHVIKMPLELVQLLYTAWCALEGEDSNGVGWRKGAPLGPKPENYQAAAKRALPHVNGYRSTHVYHQCAKWVRLNKGNYLQTANAALALSSEYTKRFKKVLFVHPHILWLLSNVPPTLLDTAETPTIPPQIVPDQYKCPDPKSLSDVCEAYKRYYIGEKRIWCRYTRSVRPAWLPAPADEDLQKLNEEKKNKREAKRKTKSKDIEETSDDDNSDIGTGGKKSKPPHKEKGEEKTKNTKSVINEDDIGDTKNKKSVRKKSVKEEAADKKKVQPKDGDQKNETRKNERLKKKYDLPNKEEKKVAQTKEAEEEAQEDKGTAGFVRVHVRKSVAKGSIDAVAPRSDNNDMPFSSASRSRLSSLSPSSDEDDAPLLAKKGASR